MIGDRGVLAPVLAVSALWVACAAGAQTPAGGAPSVAAGGMPPVAAASAPAGDAPAGGAPAADVPAGGVPVGAVTAGGLPPGATSTAAMPAGGMPPGGAPAAAAPAGGVPPGAAPAGGTPPLAGAAGGAPPLAGAGGESGTGAPAESQGAAAPLSSPAPTAQAKAPPPPPVYENVSRTPMPAFIEPLAAKSLMLDVTRAGKRLVAVGAHGNIVTSIDDGKHWVQSHSPVRELLTAVTFANPRDGWAVGHDAVILGTTDGGKTWKLQHFDPKAQAPFLNVYFSDPSHGFAVGAFGALMQTSDGGDTWHEAAASNIRADQLNFYAMTRLHDGRLLMAGEQGLVDVSADGGASWEKLPPPWHGSLFGALPAGDHGALVFGLRGHAYISDDVTAGDWRRVPTSTTASFYGGSVLADGRFVLVGAAGMIMVVSADGRSVQRVDGPSSHDYDAILPLPDHWVLAGMHGVLRTKAAP